MDSVLASALVGTTHQAPPAGGPEPWEAGMPAVSPERGLLLRAGAWAVYQQAGKLPLAPRPVPSPAPREVRPACSVRAEGLLLELEAHQRREHLLPEAFKRLEACGQRLPHRLLPAMLGTREKALREAMRPVLGEHGPWLAQFNPAWAWAQRVVLSAHFDEAELATLWQEGTAAERLEALRRGRQEDPTLGRAWLMEGFSREKADQRAAWVRVLGETLVPDDEAFLEICLGDRAGEVRAQAARLLARLPGSALAARMRERAIAHVRFHKGLFKTTFAVEGPQELPNEWARDGIAGQYPGGSPRDGWIRDLVSFVPPDFWQTQFGSKPEQVVAIAAKSDDTLPFLLGLADAVAAFEATSWAPTLLHVLTQQKEARAWDRQECFRTPIAEMLGRVPAPKLEAMILERLMADDLHHAFNWLAEFHAPWGDRLASEYMARLRRHLEKVSQQFDYQYWTDPWVSSLACMGDWLPPDALSRLEAAIPPQPVHGVSAASAEGAPAPHSNLLGYLDRAREVLALRQRIQKEITP